MMSRNVLGQNPVQHSYPSLPDTNIEAAATGVTAIERVTETMLTGSGTSERNFDRFISTYYITSHPDNCKLSSSYGSDINDLDMDDSNEAFYNTVEECSAEFHDAEDNPEWFKKLEGQTEVIVPLPLNPSENGENLTFDVPSESQLPSHETLLTSMNQLLEQLKSPEHTPETVSIMHPNGILDTLLHKSPDETKPLIMARLNALMADTKTWWRQSNKEEAQKQLKLMSRKLNDGDFKSFLKDLKSYESNNRKIPFQTIVHGLFTNQLDVQSINLFKPEKEGLFQGVIQGINDLESRMDRVSNSKEYHDSAISLLENADIPMPHSWDDKETIFTEMLQTSPQAISKLLFAYRLQDLMQTRQGRATGSESAESTLQYCADRLLKLNALKSADDINAFIDKPENTPLKQQLENECAAICYEINYQKLMNMELSELSQEELNDIAASTDLMISAAGLSINEQQHNSMKEELTRFSTVLKLTQFMNAEKQDDLSERTYMLATPPTAHLIKKLRLNKDDPETQLYENIVHYLEHLSAFRNKSDFPSMIAFQQASFDLKVQQEKVISSETKALLEHNPEVFQLSPGSYEKNTALLVQMDKAIQANTPVRPLLNSRYAFLQIGIKRILKDRPTCSERLAELQHIKDIKDSGYDFKTELSAFCLSIPDAKKAFLDRVNQVLTPTLDSIRGWMRGNGSAWQMVVGMNNNYRSLESEASSVLKETLNIAERNPILFRRMIGDTAQSFEQLKTLVGINNSGLIGQLQARVQAESAASLFAGDQAQIVDFDYFHNPDDAARLRRFKMLCDLANMAMNGTTLASALQTLTTTTVSSQVGGLVGGATAAIATMGAGTMVGYQMGSAAGAVVQTAIQTGGAIAVREGVNQLDGRSVRALDKLINYGPMFAFTNFPFGELALISRHVAKNKGGVSAVLSRVLAPYTFRLKKLTEAMWAVRHHESGAWSKLASEGAKCLLIAAASTASVTLLSSTAFHSGLLMVSLSPFILLSGRKFCRLVNKLDHTTNNTKDGLAYYRQHLLPEGSNEALAVQRHCQEQAQRVLEKMSTQSPFKQYIRESVTAELAIRYWNDWQASEANSPLAQSYQNEVKKELNETKEARQKLAEELEKSIQVMNLLKEYQAMTNEPAKDYGSFDELKQKLKEIGYPCPDPSQGAEYYIQDQILEISMALTRQCGTNTHGTTKDEIYEALTSHHENIIRGDHLMRLANVSHPIKTPDVSTVNQSVLLEKLTRHDLIDIKKQVVKKVQDNLRTEISLASNQRVNLILDTVLADVVQIHGQITPEKLNSNEVRNLIGNSLENQERIVEDMQKSRFNNFTRNLDENELYKNMSYENKQLIVDQSVLSTNAKKT